MSWRLSSRLSSQDPTPAATHTSQVNTGSATSESVCFVEPLHEALLGKVSPVLHAQLNTTQIATEIAAFEFQATAAELLKEAVEQSDATFDNLNPEAISRLIATLPAESRAAAREFVSAGGQSVQELGDRLRTLDTEQVAQDVRAHAQDGAVLLQGQVETLWQRVQETDHEKIVEELTETQSKFMI